MLEVVETMRTLASAVTKKSSDFIRDIIDADLASGKHTTVATRFPPEPNGYLHIGHAKSICLNFGLAKQYNGTCNLRFDDTNPAKEDQKYVDSIASDIRWLGFDYGDGPLFASDYFETMYGIAQRLIAEGKAYVCSLSDEETRAYRGSLKEAGRPSPTRDQSPSDNLALFKKMRAGDFPNGSYVLRAKIDMSASNMKMRDPLLYRIRHDTHHRTGTTWPIYPMYDFAHPIEDAIEGITHSICTLEFENNRQLYDWIVANAGLPCAPKQIEFARLALDYTVMSKRKFKELVDQKRVSGWDDPRMPTIAGMRRRGYRAEAIVRFCDMIGVSKNNSVIDIGKLEYAVRDDLNQVAPRVMAVLRPLKLTITNYPEGKTESLPSPFFPADIGKPGERDLPFSSQLFIEQEDFAQSPSKGFRRLAPGRWIRLRHAYCLRCDEVVVDEAGEVSELKCSYDPDSLGQSGPQGEKVWGVIHWVDAKASLPAKVRIYDRLFKHPRPGAGDDFMAHLNEESLSECEARIEPSVASPSAGTHFQFERQGYFVKDNVDSRDDALVFNRVIGLRDSWAKKNSQPTVAKEVEIKKEKNSRSATRPKSRSKSDIRNAARKADTRLADRLVEFQTQGISESDADLLSGSLLWGDRLLDLTGAGMSAAEAAKWLIHTHPRHDEEPVDFASDVSEFIAVSKAAESRISSSAARNLWKTLATTAATAEDTIAKEGLEQVSDDTSLQPLVDKVLADNQGKVEAYRSGKTALIGFFVGQVMRASKGCANAERVKEVLLLALAPKE